MIKCHNITLGFTIVLFITAGDLFLTKYIKVLTDKIVQLCRVLFELWRYRSSPIKCIRQALLMFVNVTTCLSAMNYSNSFMICTILIHVHTCNVQCSTNKSCSKIITRTIEVCDLNLICILIFVIVTKPLKKVIRKYLNKR